MIDENELRAGSPQREPSGGSRASVSSSSRARRRATFAGAGIAAATVLALLIGSIGGNGRSGDTGTSALPRGASSSTAVTTARIGERVDR